MVRPPLIQVGLVVLLLTWATGGCRLGRSPPSESAPRAEWSLTVTNRHWLDVKIQVIYDGQRARIGTVPAAQAETYVLPAHMIGPGSTIRLEADAIGSTKRATTEPLTVLGGQHVAWTLENGLERSSVAVR